MSKAPIGRFLWGVFAWTLAALLTACQTAPTPTAIELDRLQGHWEGKGAGGDCSITITGNSIRYRAGPTWYHATFVIPAITAPQQLRTTITESGPTTEFIGKEVFVVYKLEDGTLTLTTYDPADEPPKTFTGNNLYVVKKAQPQTTNVDPPKSV